MAAIAETAPVKKPARWSGRVLSGLVIVFLLFDGAIKLVPWPVVTETMDKMGYGFSETLARNLGLVVTQYTSGWYEKSGAQLYVNRGIGTTGFPIRLGARPEITVLELVRGV